MKCCNEDVLVFLQGLNLKDFSGEYMFSRFGLQIVFGCHNSIVLL